MTVPPYDSATDHTPGPDAEPPRTIHDIRGELQGMLADPEVERRRPDGDPHTWQEQFEAEIRAISERGAGLAEDLAAVVGIGETKVMAVKAGATGRLLDLRLRPGARGVDAAGLTAAFAEAYAAARADARDQVAQRLADAGVEADPDRPWVEPDRPGPTTIPTH